MIEKLPSTGAPGCNTDDMLMIHAVFRSAFDVTPALVRGVADGDSARVEIVSDYVSDIANSLHEHHHNEDENLWDLLSARAPKCAEHVDQMRAEHAAVAAEIATLQRLLDDWRATASSGAAELVAAEVERIRAMLFDHLGEEETQILPAASTALSQAEWDVLGEKGMAAIPRDKMFVSLGYMMRPMTEAQRTEFYRTKLPLPARAMWRLFGKRQYEAEYRKVFQSEP